MEVAVKHRPRPNRHIGTFVRHKPIIDDAFFISLIKEIEEEGLKPQTVSRAEVMAAIASGSVSPEIVEDFEDAVLLSIMEEEDDNEIVSEAEIMDILS
jgi:hypothetical protein